MSRVPPDETSRQSAGSARGGSPGTVDSDSEPDVAEGGGLAGAGAGDAVDLAGRGGLLGAEARAIGERQLAEGIRPRSGSLGEQLEANLARLLGPTTAATASRCLETVPPDAAMFKAAEEVCSVHWMGVPSRWEKKPTK